MTHIVNIILLLLGLAAVIYGVVALIRTRGQWLAGAIVLIVVGIILLAVGGFIQV